jgi:hypothetical protein
MSNRERMTRVADSMERHFDSSTAAAASVSVGAGSHRQLIGGCVTPLGRSPGAVGSWVEAVA